MTTDPIEDFTRRLFGRADDEAAEPTDLPEPSGPRAPQQKSKPSAADRLAYGKSGDMNDFTRRLFGRD